MFEALSRSSERGRKLIQELMQTASRDRVTTALFSMALRKNPPAVVIDREQDLPPQYLLQPQAPPPMPDKKAIAAALKSGTPVPGAHAEQRLRLEIH